MHARRILLIICSFLLAWLYYALRFLLLEGVWPSTFDICLFWILRCCTFWTNWGLCTYIASGTVLFAPNSHIYPLSTRFIVLGSYLCQVYLIGVPPRYKFIICVYNEVIKKFPFRYAFLAHKFHSFLLASPLLPTLRWILSRIICGNFWNGVSLYFFSLPPKLFLWLYRCRIHDSLIIFYQKRAIVPSLFTLLYSHRGGI